MASPVLEIALVALLSGVGSGKQGIPVQLLHCSASSLGLTQPS